ncbi:MAG: T9SS C-terminal target domain-containing protein [Chitinophagaceae bacterium]|nr:MAG: T9SS C-terminal target domain-containing protein [Chitinophagaceae bacterium]
MQLIKSIVVIFLCCNFNSFLFAQTGEPLAPIGSEWCYNAPIYPSGFPPPEFKVIHYPISIEVVGDTILHGKHASVIDIQAAVSTNQTYGYYRMDSVALLYKDGNQVYWYNTVLDSFVLYYDLDLNPGDKWEIHLPCDTSMVAHTPPVMLEVEVLSKDTIMQNGIALTRITTNLLGTIVENVGSLVSPFPTSEFYCVNMISHTDISGLRSFESDALGTFQGTIDFPCEDTIFVVSVEEVLEKNQGGVHFYPNPAFNKLNIEASENFDYPLTMYLHDMSGKLVKSESVSDAHHTLLLSGLSKGMYIIRIYSDDQLLGKSKVVIGSR